MTSYVGTCRLCLGAIKNDNFEIVTDSTRDILNTLSITLDADSDGHVICSLCSGKLLEAFDFKSTCMYTNSVIVTYVGLEKLTQHDLRDIYLKERDDKNTVSLTEDDKICRLCMELTGKMFVPLQEVDTEMVQTFLYEIEIKNVKNPVICKNCFHSLVTHINFLKQCWSVQGSTKSSVQAENCTQTEQNLPKGLIKTEDVSIKIEDKYSRDSYMEIGKINIETLENDVTSKKRKDVKKEIQDDQFSYDPPTAEVPQELSDRKKYKCTIVSISNPNNLAHQLLYKNKSKSQTYSCDQCNYTTTRNWNLKKHQIVHKDSSQVKMHQCDHCDYRAKFKYNLKKHLLIHADRSQLQMYKCNVCDYETFRKDCYTKHQLIHKDPSQVQMHKCDGCEYETKFKDQLKIHQLVHKDPSQLRMHKCNTCDYKTRKKGNLKTHELIHKDPSQVEMHKCDVCHYETRNKGCLKMHQLTHKDPSQVPMYRCDMCDYETKFKYKVKRHQLIHKDPSQVPMYKCYNCDYKTKRKDRIETHLLIHKNPAEVDMYQCQSCDYQSKYRSHLNRHQLMHKDKLDCDLIKEENIIADEDVKNSM